ncbi:MAG: hypothetical protein QXI32_01470 [Candidatus Bathyarchaeia archaeon]
MRPLESAPIFLKPRVRLRYQVPIAETVELVRASRDDEKYYPAIRDYVKSVVAGSLKVFAQDVFDLTILRLGIEAHQYRLTAKSRCVLGRRLCTTYADGLEFKAAAAFLKGVHIEPILRLRPMLIESEELASEAVALTKGIGLETDIELGEYEVAL